MRLLTICHMAPSRFLPRHGIFLQRQARFLAERGIECTFVVPRPWAPWPLIRYRRWAAYGPSNWLLYNQEWRNYEVRYLRLPGRYFRRYEGGTMARAVVRLARKMHRQTPFDGILSCPMIPDALAAVAVKEELDLPLATLAIGSDVMVYPKQAPALEGQLREAFCEVDVAMGVSQAICDRLQELGAQNPLCVYLGRDSELFSPAEDKMALRRKLGWPVDSVVGLYVGRLSDTKGAEELYQASRPLLREQDFFLVCAGDGPARAKLGTLLDRGGGEITGELSPEDVVPCLQAADFFVFPSHSEGMPQAVLEAMHCGLPIIATRVGGIPEAVKDGDNGLLVDPHDIGALRQAMERMIKDANFRKQAGQRSLQQVADAFDSTKNATRMARALLDMTTDRQPKRTRVCHLSTVHRPDDVRIFLRECRSLVQSNYDVHLVIGDVQAELKEGVTHHPLPRFKNRVLRMLLGPWIALRVALKTNADLYHYHDPELIGVGFLLRWLWRTPVVFDVHECVSRQLQSKPYLRPWMGKILGRVYRLLERVLTVGQTIIVANQNSIEDYPTCTLVQNYPILDTTLLPARRFFNGESPTLVYLGNLSEIRGAHCYLELARRLHEQGRDFKMHLIGEHSETLGRELQEKVTKWGLDDRVHISGRMDWYVAMKIVSKSTIGLCLLSPVPNYTSCLATKIIEYMMVGTPVLASNFDCWRPYVEAEKVGVMTNPMDLDQVFVACERMLDDMESLEDMSQRGQQAVQEKYNWSSEFDKLESCYERVLAKT